MKKILIVDDEHFFIEVLDAVLSEAQYQVVCANGGQAAMDMVASEQPDLILLDVVMPEIDGYQVCRWIKGQPGYADIPVIFLTVKSSVKDEAKGFEVGAVDYIAKPLSPPVVLARVKNHLELKDSKDKLQSYIGVLEEDVQARTRNLVAEIEDRKEKERLLRQQETEVREMLDNVLVGVVTTNKSGEIVRVNSVATTIFAYDAADLLGKNISFLIPKLESLDASLDHLLSDPRSRSMEVFGRGKSQEFFPLQLGVSEVTTHDNGGSGLIFSFLDLSLQRQHEEQLTRLQKLNALGTFTSGIVHDYNNMLGLISGYAEILQAKLPVNSGLDRYVESISEAVERGANLNNKLLSFSKTLPAEASIVDLGQVVEGLRFMLEKVVTKTVELVYLPAPQLWPVSVDQGDFEDAVINLCTNAVHAMPEGGTLTIKTENLELPELDAGSLALQSGQYVCVTFADTGGGMDHQTQTKAFDPFYSTKGERGTGLGLSQVYSFVKRSKGAIKLSSRPGYGACFELFFPRMEVVPKEGR
jgi:PAS domain S-box-containing protein